MRNDRLTIRISRVLMIAGVLLALVGLTGHYLASDVPITPLTAQQKQLLALDDDDFHASFVIAGRDIHYEPGKSEPVYDESGEIVCWRYSGSRSSYGANTDTILFAVIRNDEISLTLLPRDLFLDEGTRKINSVYQTGGAEGLKEAVEDRLNIPIDYYAIINIDVFQRLVDALGGVEVNVPVRMYHHDCAAQLTIDLQPGSQVLDGPQASHFVRFRSLPRQDIDRLDNVKALSYSILQRLKQLNLRAVGLLPELLETLASDVETNASPALLRRLIPLAGSLTIASAATLPTVETVRDGQSGLVIDPGATEEYLAHTFGGVAREFVESPSAILMITDGSGQDGLADRYRARLQAVGVPEERIRIRPAEPVAGPMRILATVETWTDADYYSSLLGVGKIQVDRFRGRERDGVGLELVLTRQTAQAELPGGIGRLRVAPLSINSSP